MVTILTDTTIGIITGVKDNDLIKNNFYSDIRYTDVFAYQVNLVLSWVASVDLPAI